MITVEKINIFNKLGGDSDWFTRGVGNHEKKLFDNNNDWFLIGSLNQDIQLISNKMTAQSYVEKTLMTIKAECEKDAYILMANKIAFFKYFQEVASILEEIRIQITSKTNTFWVGYKNVDEFLEKYNHDIEKIKNCDFETLEKVHNYFLSTEKHQQLSISNSWVEEFKEAVTKFDKLYNTLKK